MIKEALLFLAAVVPVLLFWSVAIICSDVTDVVLFIKKNKFLEWFPEDHNPGIHKYFRLDEDWWKRKYVSNDPSKGRKKFLGMTTPPLFFDAWHGFKVLRQFFYYNAAVYPFMFALIYLGTSMFFIFSVYILLGSVFGALSYLMHKTFYADMFIYKE